MDSRIVIKTELHRIRLALSFLTLLPVAPKIQAEEKDFARSIKYFSLVGLVFGAVNLLILLVAQNTTLVDKPWLIALALVLVRLFLSGALHLDGLMDSFDGIACGRKERAGILEVMKDSRVGAFGAMAAVVNLLVQVICLAQVDYQNNFYSLVFLLSLMPAVSRFMMILAIEFQVSSVNLVSSLSIFKTYEHKFLDTFLNIVWIKIAGWALVAYYGFRLHELIKLDLIFIPWMIATWFVYLWLRYKLKGHNGDSMGAGLEISESLLLFVIAIFI